MAEFLPLCDVLFNVISLAGYFCDVVFDVVMGYALLERGYKGTFAAAISIVLTSLLISQIISLRWYLHIWSSSEETRKGRPPWMPVLLHCLQLGVLWRYGKLFVPVDLRNVKHEVRDLCMLRLVHAFCEAAPMLLLQLHVLFEHKIEYNTHSEFIIPREPSIDEPTANKAFAELNVISASLSLFSVCWALASFSKNVRLQNVHRLVLTWLGVIFQFLWRLGTISARICALSAYALVYRYWVFLVIGLHWVSMFLWLISPKNVFHGERISRPRKAYLSALIAFVYVFAYINLQELNHRQKMVTFYCVMLIENCLLISAWAWGSDVAPMPVALSCLAAFVGGLAFMLIYYRYFHVRRLGYILGENQQGTNSTNASSQNKCGKQAGQSENPAIAGVFNCRFSNPVGNGGGRKKKKPTSFIPPPAAPSTAFWRRPLPAHHHHGGSSENEGSSIGSRVNIQQKLQEKKQKQLAELRVIEEEIKQGKLAKTSPVAAEEIYCSLQRQPIPRSKTHADPPTWPSVDLSPYQNYPMLQHNCNLYQTYTELYEKNDNREDSRRFYEDTAVQIPDYMDTRPNTILNNINSSNNKRNYDNNNYKFHDGNGVGLFPFEIPLKSKIEMKKHKCHTPEILLAPHYLDGCSRQVCCHWGAPYTKKEEDEASSGSESAQDIPTRPHSDIDSQISLPRSYTLPREFRYLKRRPRLRDARAPSNNSSDGDVDSAGENDSDRRSNCSAVSQIQNTTYIAGFNYPERRHNEYRPAMDYPPFYNRPRRMQKKHIAKPETKL